MLDPEDLNEVIGTYDRSVADVVARFEGQIAKSLGHGVLAFFGYPHDLENETERAVLASLEDATPDERRQMMWRCHCPPG